MSTGPTGEYTRSSGDTRGLRVAKEELYAEGFPEDKTRAVAAQYFQPENYSYLRGLPDLTYLVAPSTTGHNKLPVAVAQLLQQRYGGQIVTNWATPIATRRTATMDGITKLRNPPGYQINRDVTATLVPGATFVLVDDVVTTGGSIAAMREALAREGLRVEQVTSLAQPDLRKVGEADIDRITTKLGHPSLRPDIALALDGRLKHFANYIETSIRKTDAERNEEISAYFRVEAQRLRELGRTDAGAILGIAERVERLASVQSQPHPEAGLHAGLSREGRDLRPGPDRPKDGPGLKVDTEAVLARLDAIRAEYHEKPGREKILEAREAVDDLPAPDITKIPLAVAAQEYIEGRVSRVELEMLAAEADRSREVRSQLPTLEYSYDAGQGLDHER